MKIYTYTIDEAKFFADDEEYPNIEFVRDEIASRLDISSSEVYISEEETIEENY